jgi:serine/threonine protein phosphatase PrpC
MKKEDLAQKGDQQAAPKARRKRDARAILDQCRDMAIAHLAGAFPTMMDKVDDALFDRVNQSENSSQHSVYLDTMRDMRLKRTDIEAKFKERFIELVEEAIKRVRSAQGESVDDPTPELKLDLLDESDLEESLAVTTMVSKIRGSCHEILFPFEKRIAHLLGQDELKAEDNPLGPEPICQAFKDSCGVVETTVEVKLIILKLFDRHVVSEAEGIYEELNAHLIDKGVLPDIRHEVVKRKGDGGAKRKSAQAQQAAEALLGTGGELGSEDVLGALQQVMNAAGSGAPAAVSPQASARQVQVVQNLTQLQHGSPQAMGEGGPSIDPGLINAGDTNVLRELKTTEITAGMGQIDVIMFDVVAMMFDFILDDDNVPNPMKALIGRLQIPLLKVALLDKTFFSRKNHPARKLLNTLADAAVGWDETHDDGGAYYSRIEKYVHQVMEQFEDDMDVFESVGGELEAFLAGQEQVAKKTTEGSAESITSQERLATARRTAQETIAKSFHGKPVPDRVQKFFQTRWKELLVFHHFDQGEDSDGWRGAVETMDQLVWSLTPIADNDDRKKLVGLLPGLLNRVKSGMEQISLPADERKHFLATLANHHLAAVRPGEAPPPPQDGPDTKIEGVHAILKYAVERANAVIHRAAVSKPECAGMGTTLAAARFHDNKVTVAHVGDSRVYRFREGKLQQLTLDHSLMQELINKGFYDLEQAKTKVKRNVITRAVGVEESVNADVKEVPVAPGDLFLLCSDGLTDMVEDEDIRAHLEKNAGNLVAATDALVDLANRKGGKDNISVVLARVLEPFPAADPITARVLEGKIDITGKTDTGRRRSHNEDGIAIDTDAGIAMVADGMGGCNAGEVASAMAVEIIMRSLREEIEGRVEEEDDSDLSWLMATGEVDVDDYLPEEDAEHVEQRYVDFVSELEVGTWLEFKQPDGTSTRGRLAWISPDSGRYLFTDLEGVKVADSTQHGLALELQRANATLIEDEPLVDRVMTNVTERLQSGEPGQTVH